MSSNPLGDLIRAARERHGFSVRQLARLVGIAYPTVSRIENGHNVPKPDTLRAISKALDLDYAELVGHTNRATLRSQDITYLRRRPLAVELLRRMTDADVKERGIKKMIKLTKA